MVYYHEMEKVIAAPWRCIEGVKVQIHAFLTSALD
jgi:hypothetical protein